MSISNKFELIDDIIDAFGCAKEAYESLPPLPSNVKPVYFRVLNALYRTRDDSGSARVSDINKTLNFLLPNTTRYLREMEQLGIIEKSSSNYDKRVVLVKATESGEKYIQKYVVSINKNLEKELTAISEHDFIIMIESIHKVYDAIKKIYQKIE